MALAVIAVVVGGDQGRVDVSGVSDRPIVRDAKNTSNTTAKSSPYS